jgi:para-aminobenzoate synthetase / 4-amino-4-deoxychorismate lyase
MTHDESSAVFALLDDCDSTAERRSSRLYSGFVREIVCRDGAALDRLCGDEGLHGVVIADYEFGRNLQRSQSGEAALRFLLFRECTKLSRDEVDQWLAERDNGDLTQASVAGVAGVTASVSRDQFGSAIAKIHAALRAGDSYQVNYTYRLAFNVFGSVTALYRRLRVRQPVRYGGLIALPDGRAVLSCSPELFIERAGNALRARPMKGTAPRHSDPEALRHDPKNRAENVMIVDLLRNDMSRVAATGSVKTTHLFDVEAYQSVWQMTSTIEARLRPGTSFAAILRALMPCGSITGAPKHRTMQLIDTLETTPRGLYTGAIGWRDTNDDFCLCVPIRTLEIDGGKGTMGVGAGIVLDSMADDEYAECQLKAQFLTGAEPGFQLFETTYATREGGIRHADRHIDRLRASAEYFGFPLDSQQLAQLVQDRCAGYEPGIAHRLKIALNKAGEIALSGAPLIALKETTVNVLLASDYGFGARVSDDPLLRHKTTFRDDYDRAWHAAEKHDAFDMLFFNERGELTEGGRTNVFVKRDGRWFTPPLSAGVLPGVMRGVLIDELSAEEKTLEREDLSDAELIVCNALRGGLTARLRLKR